jgi:hypothetical protein
MARFYTPPDDSTPGPTGPEGPAGPAGADGETPDLSSYTGDILPALDNTYVLGNSSYRWKSISVGDGTIYITDAVTENEAALTIEDGVFFIDGIAQAQLPNIQVTNLTFADNSVQTTAAVAQVNSDWDATSGLAEILNKPDIASEAAPTETSFTVNGGTLGTPLAFNGDPLFSGTYVKTGPIVHFQIQVDMDNITNFGTGQYYVDLPFPAKYGYKFREGCLHDISTTRDYEMGGHVYAGESRLALTSMDTQSSKVFDIPFTYNHPITLTTADNFHISGTYIAEPL